MNGTYDTIYFELAKNLMTGSLFFITDEILGEMDEEIRNKSEGYTNQLIFLDGAVGPYFVGQELIAHKVLNKQMQLDRNIYELLKWTKKDKHDPESRFLIERYREQVLGYWKVAQWLFDNCQERIQKLKKDHRNAFKLQLIQISGHYSELEKQFFKYNPKKISLEPVLQVQDIKNIQEFILSPNHLPDKPKSEQNGEEPIDRKERLSRLKGKIEKEGEKYILESVFNVKFDS